jgi:mannose-1-phosphate guanylyltransferase / mannose-6-phosphate isomerase
MSAKVSDKINENKFEIVNGSQVANLYNEVRPWGAFYNLVDGEYKMKIITILPKGELSVQSHSKRSEKWVCIEGSLTINLGHDPKQLTEYTLFPNQVIDIPVGTIHQAINKTNKSVVFFELQTGSYFGEDDIIRYSDIYGRV